MKQKQKQKFTDRLRSLQFILTLTTSVIVAAVVVPVSILQYNRFNQSLISNKTTNSTQMVEQVANTLNSYMRNLLNTSDKIIENLAVHENALYDEEETGQKVVTSAFQMNTSIAAISIFDRSGNILAIAPQKPTRDVASIISQQWYQNAKLSESSYVFSPPHIQNIFKGEYFWTVTLSRRLSEAGDVFPEGTLFMLDMNFEQMDEYCTNATIGKRGYVYIVDEGNNIIYHPQQQVINVGLKEEDLAFIGQKPDGEYIHTSDDSVMVIRTLENTGWRLVGISYLNEASEVRNEIISYLAAVLIAGFLAIFVISLIISKIILRPLEKLTSSMKLVRDGNFDIRAETNSIYEVEQLSISFNHMVNRINELMGQVILEEQELRKSELKALQSQINPHFLYNTLGSILWMCEKNRGPEAAVMVSALASLFRISISKGKELIPIRDELTHAESYLIIQKMRYKDQFTYTIEADESLKDYLCPKISLQPIIENAIYHGIDRCVDKGEIHIHISEKGSDILMQVTDNGLGMSEKVLAGILQSESQNDYGIGLKNVDSRVKIFFGKQYGITIESQLDEGTCVSILIPRITEDVTNV